MADNLSMSLSVKNPEVCSQQMKWQIKFLKSAFQFLQIITMDVFQQIKNSSKSIKKYRKRPCISRTFFHKIEAKNQGCGLSTDTSVFGVLKNLINIHKTS